MRETPIVEVPSEMLSESKPLRIGIRVLSALAHTPAQGNGTYEAIVVTKDKSKHTESSEEVVNMQYDTIISNKVTHTDEWRTQVGEIVQNKLSDSSSFVLGRS